MKINIFDNNWQAVPLLEDKPIVEITDEEYYRLCIGELKIVNDKIVINNEPRIAELKQLLADTDYKAIKYAEGEITAEEYEPIKQQRREWRAEINELEKTLQGE